MTAPVVVKITDKKFWQMGVYTMSFLLPAEHQMNPPQPTDDKASFSDKKMSEKEHIKLHLVSMIFFFWEVYLKLRLIMKIC